MSSQTPGPMLPSTSAALSAIGEGGELFDVWAPETSPWSLWAKPVLFAQMQGVPVAAQPLPSVEVGAVLPPGRVAVIIDLPGVRALEVAMGFAQRGMRPVPLFNGVDGGPSQIVDNRPVMAALRSWRAALLELPLSDDAPPAFILDSERLARARPVTPGRFDNRWVVFPQDFPSGHKLKEHGIERAVLVSQGRYLADDLAHVLLRWQELGVAIHTTDELLGAPQPHTVQKPRGFRSLAQRLLVAAGLHRNAAGGFGSVIPVPSQGGG